ncbi:ABC transporter permease [Bacillus horti]|uniref:ABC-type antimicrobial peptide transport system permease subunit n=2 Tax=Caldalkalibacillus horti TaxID=77523 RepID=A0ABT9VVC3_9BACI|nr:ABC-type antimicrobial peptide transport system permease subunit [Bacillus horti]
MTGFQQTLRNKTISMILILSFSLGLFFSAFLLGIGLQLLEDTKSREVLDLDQTVRMSPVSFEGRSIPILYSDVEKIVQQHSNVERIHLVEHKLNQTVLINENLVLGLSLAYVDSGFDQLFKDFIVSGVMLSNKSNETAECVVGQHISGEVNLIEDPVGKRININGNECEVVGVANHPQYNKSIFLPINLLSDEDVEKPMYYVIFSSLDSILESEFRSNILKQFGEYEIDYERSVQEQVISKSRNVYIVIFGISTIVLAFALLNIINIVYFRTIQLQKRWAIALALGARKSDLYLYKISEMLAYTVCASLIVFLALEIIESVVPPSFPFRSGLSILFILLGFSIIISAVSSLLMLRKIMNKPVREILKG